MKPSEPEITQKLSTCFDAFRRHDYQQCADIARTLVEDVPHPLVFQMLLISLQFLIQSDEFERVVALALKSSTLSLWDKILIRLTHGEFDTIQPVLDHALSIDQRCQAFFYLGQIQLVNDDYASAVECFYICRTARANCLEFEMAHAELTAKQDDNANAGRINALYARVESFQKQGQYHIATANQVLLIELSLNVYGPRHPTTLTLKGNLAELLRLMGEHDDAIAINLDVLAVRREVLPEGHPDIAISLNNLATSYSSLGRYPEAQAAYFEALAIDSAHYGPESTEAAAAYQNLALVYQYVGDYAAAYTSFDRALKIWQRELGPNHPWVAACLGNMARLQDDLFDIRAAIPLYERALAILKKNYPDIHPEVAITMSRLAYNQGLLDPSPAVEAQLERAVQLLAGPATRRTQFYLIASNNLGLYLSDSGKYAEAESVLRNNLSLSEQMLGVGHPEIASDYSNLGRLMHMQKRYSEAEALYLSALQRFDTTRGSEHPLRTSTIGLLVALYGATSRVKQAVELLGQNIRTHNFVALQLFRLKSEKERQIFRNAVREDRNKYLSLLLRHSGRVSSEVARLVEYLASHKAVESEWMRLMHPHYLVDVYPELRGKVEELVAVRHELAYEQMIGPEVQHVFRFLGPDHPLRLRKKQLENDIADYLVTHNPTAFFPAYSVSQIRAALSPGTALLEFVHFESVDFDNLTFTNAGALHRRLTAARFAVIVTTAAAETPILVDLGDFDSIYELLYNFRTFITGQKTPYQLTKESRGETIDYALSARILYQRLLQPVEAYVRSSTQLIIIPDQELFKLPFEALVLPDGSALIDHYTITYLSSSADLVSARYPRRTSEKGEAIVIAAPDFDARDSERRLTPQTVDAIGFAATSGDGLRLTAAEFQPLAGTRQEGEDVAQRLGVQPWLGANALEGRIKTLHSPLVLHLATHGYFLNDLLSGQEQMFEDYSASLTNLGLYIDNPLLRSGIALAGANWRRKLFYPPPNAEDGLLTAEDVIQLDLHGTKLVVLSACETGLGEIRRDEGVLGLARSFLVAGVAAVVVSLWRVPDQQTARFMKYFYEQLVGGATIAEALKSTKQYMKQRYPNLPLVWAGFVAFGEAGTRLELT